MIVLFGLCASFAGAQSLELPSHFASGMVLQQHADVELWGQAAPGAEVRVTVSWDKAAHKAVSDDNGRWRVVVRTPCGELRSLHADLCMRQGTHRVERRIGRRCMAARRTEQHADEFPRQCRPTGRRRTAYLVALPPSEHTAFPGQKRIFMPGKRYDPHRGNVDSGKSDECERIQRRGLYFRREVA